MPRLKIKLRKKPPPAKARLQALLAAKSVKDAAKDLGMDEKDLRALMAKRGLKLPAGRRSPQGVPTKTRLSAAYRKTKTVMGVVRELGISWTMADKLLRQHGLIKD